MVGIFFQAHTHKAVGSPWISYYLGISKGLHRIMEIGFSQGKSSKKNGNHSPFIT